MNRTHCRLVHDSAILSTMSTMSVTLSELLASALRSGWLTLQIIVVCLRVVMLVTYELAPR